MKNHAKRALAILLVCVMALSLAACGAKVDEAVVGRYSLITYSYMGLEFPAGYGDIDGYIELKKSGTLTVQLTTGDDDDNIGSGKFSIEGTTMTIDDGDDTLTATIENNVITLEEGGVTFVFAKDGSDEAAALIDARDAAGDEAAIGRYSLITYSYEDVDFPAGYGDVDGYIELEAAGMLSIQLTTGDSDDDDVGTGAYSIEGTTMTIDDGSDTLTATIENNVITLEEDDVTFRFARDGSDEAAALIEARDAVRTTLTGTWAVEGALTLVFREDGTGQLDENEPFVFFGSDSVVYLVYDSDNTTETLRYTLSEDGSALTITTDDGDDITLQRQ